MLGQMLGGLLVVSVLGFRCGRGFAAFIQTTFSVRSYMKNRKDSSLWRLYILVCVMFEQSV